MSLVVVVPSQSGMVIAADSRMGLSLPILGLCCFFDTAYKIQVSERPTTVAVSVTGNGEFYPPLPPGKALTVHFSEAPMFSLRDRLHSWLNDQPPGEIDEALINRARAFCVAEMSVQDFVRRMPAGEINCVILVSNRAPDVGLCFSWSVIIDADRNVRCGPLSSREYRPDDQQEYAFFGATDYVNKNVLGEPNLQRFATKLMADWEIAALVFGMPIRDVAPALALKWADLLINSTSEAMTERPDRFGVGGPVDAYLIGAGQSIVLRLKREISPSAIFQNVTQ